MRENDLLEHIYKQNALLDSSISIPPGDDMAALQYGQQTLLIGVDQLIDGTHIRLDKTNTLEHAAHKLVLRNLSDVAAMAAVPIAATVTAALPRSITQADAELLSDLINKKAGEYGCAIIGGDTSIHDGPLHLTMTVLAKPLLNAHGISRQGAKAGDAIYVSGELGGAWQANGKGRHIHHTPALACIKELLESNITPSAMMDISDGLAMDLIRLCKQSQCAAEIFIDQLPCHEDIAKDDKAAWQHAMDDGEDYELLLIIPKELSALMPEHSGKRKLTKIGQIISGTPRIELRKADATIDTITSGGWEHRTNE